MFINLSFPRIRMLLRVKKITSRSFKSTIKKKNTISSVSATRSIRPRDPLGDCTFYTYCKDGDQIIGQGFGGSKKEASQMAAKDALERLKKNHEQI